MNRISETLHDDDRLFIPVLRRETMATSRALSQFRSIDAVGRKPKDVAEELVLRFAAAGGDPAAATSLGMLLKETGDRAEAAALASPRR
jgi:hypothetical protein